jgi:hypothetical protein
MLMSDAPPTRPILLDMDEDEVIYLYSLLAERVERTPAETAEYRLWIDMKRRLVERTASVLGQPNGHARPV